MPLRSSFPLLSPCSRFRGVAIVDISGVQPVLCEGDTRAKMMEEWTAFVNYFLQQQQQQQQQQEEGEQLLLLQLPVVHQAKRPPFSPSEAAPTYSLLSLPTLCGWLLQYPVVYTYVCHVLAQPITLRPDLHPSLSNHDTSP